MKKFFQIVGPALLCVVIFGGAIFLYALPEMATAIMDKKRETTKELVGTVIELLATYEREVAQGRIDRPEAQRRVLARIEALRYGPERKDYFWINDLHPRMLMHPYRKDLAGKDLNTLQDLNGNFLFADAVKKALQPEGGYIEYDWQWKDNPHKTAHKISYVSLFQPWGWVVGSGIYYEEVTKEIGDLTRNLVLAAFGALLAVGLFAMYLTQKSITISKERKAALEALALSEEKFRGISANANDGIVMMDPDGKVSFWNKAAEKIFGYAEDEIIGEQLHALLSRPEDGQRFKTAFLKFLKDGSGAAVGRMMELKAVRKDHCLIPLELSVSGLKRDGKWHAVGIIRDISERMMADKEKQHLQRCLQQAQKMEAIGTLAGGIAHDFNNILLILLGNAELAQMRYDCGEDISKPLEEVRAAGMRARDLVQQIHDFSRQTEKKKQHMSVASVIKETLKLLRSSTPTTIVIQTTILAEKAMVFADPTNIYQVVMNLCTNAVHAMRARGGVLRVTLKEVSVDAFSTSPFGNLPPRRYLELVVSDTGHGISPDIQERIFEPYFTTKHVGEGTGIGLSMVHGIIKDIDGAIDVDSEPGKGSCFTLLMPMSEADAPSASPQDVTHIPPGSGHVLVVDDEIGITEACRQMLVRIGYRVTTVNESPKALKLFQSAADDYDFIITDLTMPQMTGIELTRRVKSIRPDIPVVLWTGDSERLKKANFDAYGFDYLIMKPPLMKDIADVLYRAAEEKLSVGEKRAVNSRLPGETL